MVHAKRLPGMSLVGVLVIACSSSPSKPAVTGAAGKTGTAGATGAAGAGSTGSGGAAGGANTDAGSDKGHAGGDAAAGPDSGGEAGGEICHPVCTTGMICLNTACLPAPVELARVAGGCGAMALAVAGGTLYFTDQDHGTVSSVATAGGAAAKILAMTQAMPLAIVADDTGVYWANQGDNTIMKAALPAGTVTTLTTATAPVQGLAVRAGVLFFSRAMDVLKISTAGGAAPTPVGSSVGKPIALALDATMVYWNADLEAAVQRHPQDGSGMTAPIAESQGSLLLNAIDIVGGQVIWASAGTITSKAGPTSTKDDASHLIVGTANSDTVTGFVATDTTVYLGEDGQVEKAPLPTANEATVIAKGQPEPSSFAADATHIYWRTKDCAILKLPQ
jgi:hypothetical protein